MGFRNVLAQGYEIVDDAVAWDAITTDRPVLTAMVETLLAELDDRGERGRASLAHLRFRPRFVLENVAAAESWPAAYRKAG